VEEWIPILALLLQTKCSEPAKSTDFVEKITWILAAILFVLCIITAMMVSGTTGGAETIQDIQ
jgi:preprotein translocase subunit SecG